MDQTIPPKPKAKPRGAPAAVHEKLARLDVLAHKAIRFWEKTLDDKSDATTGEKIQVSKLVVEYAWGKPKQQIQVDARVEINHKAHIEALVMLANAVTGPIIDSNPLNQITNFDNGPNLSLLSNGSLIDRSVNQEAIGPLVDWSVNQELAQASRPEDPPPPPRNPGPGNDMEQPRPLDTKNDE